jgi:Kef-type K+ transport system membrane component KefB
MLNRRDLGADDQPAWHRRAFLAGLAVNAALRAKLAKVKLEFIGNSFFTPIFFVTDFLINSPVFTASIVENFYLVIGIIVALLVGNWLAAQAAGQAF